MTGLAQWNRRQILVLGRLSARFGVALTPEVVADLAGRFARKHDRSIDGGRGPAGRTRPLVPASPSHTPAPTLRSRSSRISPPRPAGSAVSLEAPSGTEGSGSQSSPARHGLAFPRLAPGGSISSCRATAPGAGRALQTNGGTMSRTPRFAPLCLVGVLALAACQDDAQFPTAPALDPAPAQEPVASVSQTESRVIRPHEARFHEIAKEVKSFGGYHYDEAGTLIALIGDPADEKRVREMLQQELQSRTLSQRQKSPGSIVVRRAAYPFLQLAAWRDGASDPVLETKGVEFTDLDEAKNRLVVGVSSAAARDEAAKKLREQQVPLEAVVFEEVKPVQEFITLRDRRRPIEGGYQIANSNGICTLGFNATWAGNRAFLTNSHCTNSFWANDGVSIYQNVVSSTNLIGTEAHDPAAWSCGIFGLYRCRYSDAAVIRKNSSVGANFGKIARTTFWKTGAGVPGSLTVDPNRPRMTITGEYSFPKGGEMFDKMGRTTGWTYGFVKKTCVDVNKSGNRRVLCQDYIGGMHATFGDSGSPIFRWHGSTVTLAGILWGGINEGGTPYIIMSAMWNIERDLGALGTF